MLALKTCFILSLQNFQQSEPSRGISSDPVFKMLLWYHISNYKLTSVQKFQKKSECSQDMSL
jgi:hypothetical protein